MIIGKNDEKLLFIHERIYNITNYDKKENEYDKLRIFFIRRGSRNSRIPS